MRDFCLVPSIPTLDVLPEGDLVRAALTPYRLVVGALIVFLGAVVFLNGLGHFNTDVKPEVYMAPGRMLGRYLSAWTSSPYLGSPNFNVGLVPVLAVTALLRLIGLDPEWTFKVFHFVLWLLGAWGTLRLTRLLAPAATRWAGVVAAVAYLANPYAVSAGATLAIALPMCLLPWLLITLVHALRNPRSWAWPAATGCVFFAMSGMNVAVVPIFQLAAAVPVAWVVARDRRLGVRDVVLVLARCAVFVGAVSLYWLLPAVAAIGTGSQIASGSETLEGIAAVSSFPEVLRGLGMWSLYGRSDVGPWIPQHAVYLTNVGNVLLTMLWPASALLCLRWTPPRITRIAAVLIAVAAVVSVGLFPGPSSSPFGKVLRWLFEHVPGLIAFRTTNKIGAVLVLGFALALGLGVAHVARWVRSREVLIPAAIGVIVLLVGAWTVPALTNNLYISAVDVPGYWRQAAAAVDHGSSDARVLLLPGQIRSQYRWSPDRPDDLPNSLMTREAIIPETTPNTSAGGANLLSALDDTLQTGTQVAAAMSSYARYLGASQILLRHDVVWEINAGARPAVTDAVLSRDPGLFGQANFGRPGQNTRSRTSGPAGLAESQLPPVQLYDVVDPSTTVRAESVGGSLVIAGDGWALPALADAGLLPGTPMFRYAQDLTGAQLGDSLRHLGRLVLTDTNQRRDAITNRLTAGQGGLLGADDPMQTTRTLGRDPRDQTILIRTGAIVRASDQGGAFFDQPYAMPENALDDDPTTSWLFGDFRRAPGTILDVTLPAPIDLGEISVTQAPVGSVKIDRVRIVAAGTDRSVALPDSGAATVDLRGVRADHLTLTVESLRGEGFNGVGISELRIPGVTAERTARLPLTLSDRYLELDPSQRAAFTKVPLDVLMTRVRNAAPPEDDTETGLRRDFELPDERTVRATARVRVTGNRELAYDHLAGYPASVQARSSGVFFDNPDARASMAADTDPRSAWVPGGDVAGSWWELTGPIRTIDHLRIDQRAGFDSDTRQTNWATGATVSVDGVDVATIGLRRGVTDVDLDRPVRGRTVRLTLTAGAAGGEFSPPRFVTVDTGLSMRADAHAGRCISVVTVDGEPLEMRPVAGRLAAATDPGTEWTACGGATLAAGAHTVRPVAGFQLDSLALRDLQGSIVSRPSPPPVAMVRSGVATSTTIEVGRAQRPYAVVIGQGLDPRWRAKADGVDLGTPQLIDGFSAGWIVEDLARHTITISYGPQRAADLALGVSLIALAASLGLFVRARRRHTADDPDGPEAAPWGPDHLAAAPGPRRRLAREVAGVAIAGFAIGVTGLVAAFLVVGLRRWRPVQGAHLITLGAVLVALSAPLYLALIRDQIGDVDANLIHQSLWPHYLAGAGLVLTLFGAILRANSGPRPSPPEESP